MACARVFVTPLHYVRNSNIIIVKIFSACTLSVLIYRRFHH